LCFFLVTHLITPAARERHCGLQASPCTRVEGQRPPSRLHACTLLPCIHAPVRFFPTKCVVPPQSQRGQASTRTIPMSLQHLRYVAAAARVSMLLLLLLLLSSLCCGHDGGKTTIQGQAGYARAHAQGDALATIRLGLHLQ